jgi:hypothetical protein
MVTSVGNSSYNATPNATPKTEKPGEPPKPIDKKPNTDYSGNQGGQRDKTDKQPPPKSGITYDKNNYQRPYVPGMDTAKATDKSGYPASATGVQKDSGQYASGTGGVRSVNGKLVDANGKPTVLKGYNVWDPKSATLSDPNINTVRFNQKDWPGADRNPDTFLQDAKAFADANPGKTVILGHRAPNMSSSANQDRLMSPAQVQDGVNFWKKASTLFKGNPNVVFNLENEIGLKGKDNAQVYSYYEKLIPAARSGGAKNPLLIGDNGFGQGSVTPNTPIQDDFLVNYGAKLRKLDPQNNVIASIHPYNPESYDKLTQVVGQIKKSSGLPVIADEFGDHQNPNTPQWVQKAAKAGVLDGLLFWGGPDLTGAQDVSNFQKNWKPFLASLPGIGPSSQDTTTTGGYPAANGTGVTGATSTPAAAASQPAYGAGATGATYAAMQPADTTTQPTYGAGATTGSPADSASTAAAGNNAVTNNNASTAAGDNMTGSSMPNTGMSQGYETASSQNASQMNYGGNANATGYAPSGFGQPSPQGTTPLTAQLYSLISQISQLLSSLGMGNASAGLMTPSSMSTSGSPAAAPVFQPRLMSAVSDVSGGRQAPVGGNSIDSIQLDLPAERPKIDRSLVPAGGLNAGNIDQYAATLSKKFGLPKALILAQVKKESGPNFADLAHRGDTERGAAQGGPSVGPNQITEGVLTGGIWNGGAEGIDLTPQEAETNPALAMQAGLIHLTDYIKEDNGDLKKALGRYVGHDQEQYIADINMYMSQIPA